MSAPEFLHLQRILYDDRAQAVLGQLAIDEALWIKRVMEQVRTGVIPVRPTTFGHRKDFRNLKYLAIDTYLFVISITGSIGVVLSIEGGMQR